MPFVSVLCAICVEVLGQRGGWQIFLEVISWNYSFNGTRKVNLAKVNLRKLGLARGFSSGISKGPKIVTLSLFKMTLPYNKMWTTKWSIILHLYQSLECSAFLEWGEWTWINWSLFYRLHWKICQTFRSFSQTWFVSDENRDLGFSAWIKRDSVPSLKSYWIREMLKKFYFYLTYYK